MQQQSSAQTNMPKIRIVTDSACDLPPTFLEQFGIKVAPHAIRWGDEAYLPGVDITSGALIERMRAAGSEWPQVEGPDVEQFALIYRELRDASDGVLSVHASSKLSESYANAMVAREAFGPLGQGGPFPVAVVDSLQTTMGLGWMVL